jgi:hypothetical protein
MDSFGRFPIQNLTEGLSTLAGLSISASDLITCQAIPEPQKPRRGRKEKIQGIKREDLPAWVLPGTKEELRRRMKNAVAAGDPKSFGELVDEAVAGTMHRYPR